MFNVINISKKNNLKSIQEFSMTSEFKDNNTFFKNQGHNEFW